MIPTGHAIVRRRALRPGRVRVRAIRAGVLGVALILGAALLSSCGSGSPYTIKAVLPSAEGLFPGNAVDILGVARGTVTSVQPTGSYVLVTMSMDQGQALPAGVHAALTTPQLLGEPSIELYPGYTSGPKLASNTVIPESRTSVPVSIDQLLRDLQQFLGEVNPQAVSGTIQNLAQDLQGQGQGLNDLISQGAATLSLLAQKGNELGQLNGSLANITGTLRQRTSTVTELLQAYDTVGNVIAQNSGPLGDAITQLANTSQQLTELLDPNLQPLQNDIGTITQVGRTLDRNVSSLDQGLTSTVSLFAGAGRAYDPVNNWLNLNVPLAAGLTGDVVAGLVRDRLAGICRRVLANHGAGLSAPDVATLQSCGNPASGFFDPLLSVLPDLLNSGIPGSTGSSGASAQSLLAQGVTEIPGVTSSQSQQLSQVPASSLSGTSSSSQSSNNSSQLTPSNPQNPSSSSGGLIGGLLHGLLGVAHFFGSLF